VVGAAASVAAARKSRCRPSAPLSKTFRPFIGRSSRCRQRHRIFICSSSSSSSSHSRPRHLKLLSTRRLRNLRQHSRVTFAFRNGLRSFLLKEPRTLTISTPSGQRRATIGTELDPLPVPPHSSPPSNAAPATTRAGFSARAPRARPAAGCRRVRRVRGSGSSGLLLVLVAAVVVVAVTGEMGASVMVGC